MRRSVVSCLTLALALLASLPGVAAVPPSPAAIFQSSTLLRGVSLSAPLSDLFRSTQAVLAGAGDETPKLPTVRGTLRFVGASGTVESFENVAIEARGNTSLRSGQCSFPKLTLKFPKPTKGTILGGLKEIKLGTHCAESAAPLPVWGRIGNDKGPIREVLLYTVLNRVGTVTLMARPIEITYTDTSRKPGAAYFPRNPLTRKAFFLEDADSAAKRYGGKVSQKAEQVTRSDTYAFQDAASSQVDPLNVALAVLGETLADNGDDWFVRLWPKDKGPGALAEYTNWNVNIIADTNKRPLIHVYDWDTSGWVRGTRDPSGTRFHAALARLHAYPLMTTAALDAAVKACVDAKGDLYNEVDALFSTEGVQDDPEGRANIQKHLDDFFRFLESLPTR